MFSAEKPLFLADKVEFDRERVHVYQTLPVMNEKSGGFIPLAAFRQYIVEVDGEVVNKSFDPNSELAEIARSRNNVVVASDEKAYSHYELLNFVVAFDSGEVGMLSYREKEWPKGAVLQSLINSRNEPMWGCRFELRNGMASEPSDGRKWVSDRGLFNFYELTHYEIAGMIAGGQIVVGGQVAV